MSRGITYSFFACVAFLLVLFVPRPALALPNPFVLVFFIDLLLQVTIVLILVFTAGFAWVRLRMYLLFPSVAVRTLLLVVMLGSFSVLTMTMVDVPTLSRPPTADFNKRLRSCKPLSADLAAKLSLPEGAVVVDPRPSAAFASYRLRGSCNFSRDEMLTSDPVRRLLRNARGGVLLVYDNDLSLSVFFEDHVPCDINLEALAGGLRRYYKNVDGASGCGGLGEVPNLVVDQEDEPVNIQLGPLWTLGAYRSFMAPGARWRRLPSAAVPWALDRGIPVVDLRFQREDTDKLLSVPPWDAYLSTLDKVAGEEIDEVILICDDPPVCLAAEALAFQLAERGGSPYGYVLSYEDGSALATGSYLSPECSKWVVPLVLLFILVCSPALVILMVWVGRKFVARPRLSIAFKAAGPLVGIAVALPVGPLATLLTNELNHVGWATLDLIDVRRFGLGWIVAVLPVLYVVATYLVERRLERRSWTFRIALLLTLLAIIPFVRAGYLRLLTLAAVSTAMIGQLIMQVITRIRHRSNARRGDGTPRLVPLEVVGGVAAAGSKAQLLAEAHKDGMRVPAGLVLLTGVRAYLAGPSHAVLRRVSEFLGPGPLVVRSTAPDEDVAGSLTAGRYLSFHDISAEGVDEAVRKVLGDYLEKGVDGEREVGVIIQRQVQGNWAGVAVREPACSGSGILVEVCRGENFEVTEGRGAELRDRIGRFSRSWLLGHLDDRKLPARLMLEIFERLESRIGGPAQIEFSYDKRSIYVLQVRSAPEGRWWSPIFGQPSISRAN